MHCVQVPINFGAVIEIRVSQQVEAMLADSLGFVEDARGLLRKRMLQERGPFRHFVCLKEKFAFEVFAEACVRWIEVMTAPVGNPIQTFAHLLAGAGAHLVPAHPGQAQQGPMPSGSHKFPYLTHRGTFNFWFPLDSTRAANFKKSCAVNKLDCRYLSRQAGTQVLIFPLCPQWLSIEWKTFAQVCLGRIHARQPMLWSRCNIMITKPLTSSAEMLPAIFGHSVAQYRFISPL